MKILLSILAILALVFLIGCSAKDTSSRASDSEIRALGEKYGGIYIFNKKFYEEIEKRERERELVSKQISDEVSSIKDVYEQSKELRKKLKERYYNNPKIAQILSNGKQYYLQEGDYWRRTNKKRPKVNKIYFDKIYNFIGQENIKKYKPILNLGYFYLDDNNEIVPIYMSASYLIHYKEHGLFGDEGRGVKFSKDRTKDIGNTTFYLEDLEK